MLGKYFSQRVKCSPYLQANELPRRVVTLCPESGRTEPSTAINQARQPGSKPIIEIVNLVPRTGNGMASQLTTFSAEEFIFAQIRRI